MPEGIKSPGLERYEKFRRSVERYTVKSITGKDPMTIEIKTTGPSPEIAKAQ